MARIPATVTVLTYNSGKTLEKCLNSVRDFEEILVLDGGSTDDTLEIAKSFGARVEKQSDQPGPIKDFTAVRQRSFDLASHDWVFWLDSDEWIDEELDKDIARMLAADTSEKAAYQVTYTPIVDGRTIEHGSFFPLRYTRLVNRLNARWLSGKKVHEKISFDSGVMVNDLRDRKSVV
jgi:glycosyltransferase involved in cell wall biosynthesis